MGDEEIIEQEGELETPGEDEVEGEDTTELETKGADETGSAPGDDGEGDKDAVQRRIDKLTAEKKEAQEKLDLFRRVGPDTYYELYPDERPAEHKPPPAPEPGAEPSPEDPHAKPLGYAQFVNTRYFTSGPYQGRTLADVVKEDTVAVQDVYDRYRDDFGEKQAQAKQSHQERQSSIEKEHGDFIEARATEFFDKTADALSEDESKQIHDLMMKYMDEMPKHKVYSLETFHKLASIDDRIKKAVENVIKTARRGGVTHIDSKKTPLKAVVGYSGLVNATRDQLAAHLSGIRDQGAFWKKAPPELIEKFHDVAEPWL